MPRDPEAAQSACQIVTAEIRSRGTLTTEDGLVLALLDLIIERDRLRAEVKHLKSEIDFLVGDHE